MGVLFLMLCRNQICAKILVNNLFCLIEQNKNDRKSDLMNWLKRLQEPQRYGKMLLKWTVLGILMGCIGGLLGAGFHHLLHTVTHIRGEHSWLIFLLPIGGMVSVAVYHLCHLTGNRGTNEIIDAVLENKSVNTLIAPTVIVGSTITHLFGGSGGREGAALQIGASAASFLSKIFKLNKADRRVLIMSGMSAVFSGLFGTPMTACLFTLEFEAVGTIFTPALFPCYVASFIACESSRFLGVHAEVFPIAEVFTITRANSWRYFILAVLVALLGILMCGVFHRAEHFAKHYFPNQYLRIAVGGVLVTVLTLLAGNHRFNGAGMDMAMDALGGQADWYSFLAKLIFTAVTLAAGFKGGEIVPTFCIGATFGCVLGGLLGLDPGFAAALGLIGLFCSATNSPLASIVLSVEMFGGANLPMFALICVITFAASGRGGLYASQVLRFSKTTMAEEIK